MKTGLHAGIGALYAQLGALIMAAGIAFASLGVFTDAGVTLWALAGMQGMLAAMLGFALGLAWWWLPINLIFLPAALFVQQVHLPAMFYLAGFLLLLLFNWGVIHTRVPLYLSRKTVWKQVEELLPADKPYRLIDIGSGLGGMLLYLDKARPMGVHDGAEISPASWMISRIRAIMQRARVCFKREDYRQRDLSGYDVVFAFLSPLVMQQLLVKASREMKPGSLLLSLAFPLPGARHDFVIPPQKGGGQMLYGWRVRPDIQITPAENNPLGIPKLAL